MKKLLPIILICFSANLLSQNIKGLFSFGLTASQVSGDKSAKFNKIGFLFGPGAFIPFNEISGMETGLYYVQKGSRKPSTLKDPTFYKMILDYIEVPFLFSYYYQKKKVKIQAGPSFGALVRSKEEDSYGEFIGEDFVKFEIALQGGVDYPITKKVDAKVRFSNSIYYIREPQNQSRLARYWEKGQFITMLSLALAYRFNN